MTLLSNWAFAYRVPLTLQIVFRSAGESHRTRVSVTLNLEFCYAAGLSVSMVLGYVFLKRRYSYLQVFSVVIVTFGVVVATLSRPTAAPTRVTSEATTAAQNATEMSEYVTGIVMLSVACVLTSTLGILQERTFTKYGSSTWREGIFYTVRSFLSQNHGS